MPINAFGGGPGSGKTYGVMEHVILPAVAAGRFVLTNIEGLNVDAIYEYVAKTHYKGKIICIGHIRTCSRSAPELDSFFPGEDSLDKAQPVPAPDFPTVSGGDLVVIDEATRYWNAGDKVKKQHAYFFREHRHFANEQGHTCDMVVIDPDLSMLVRALKGKIELASITHKPKEIGLNKYVVKLYRGVRTSAKPTSVQGPYKFRPEIYNLYKSYSHEGAKEQAIDKRQNVFNNPRLWLYAGGLVAMLVLCVWGLYAYYQSQVKKFGGDKKVTTVSNPVLPGQDGLAVASAPGVGSPGVLGQRSETLRVAGSVVINGQDYVVVTDGRIIRLENSQAFIGRGVMTVGDVDGHRVTTWTGVKKDEKGADSSSASVVGGVK